MEDFNQEGNGVWLAFGKAVWLWSGEGRGARLKLGRPSRSSRLKIMLVLPKVVVPGRERSRGMVWRLWGRGEE